MPTTVKLTISLPQELAEFTDKLAAEKGQPRSQIIAELIESRRVATIREELSEAYREMAEESARFARDAFPLAAEVWPPYDAGPRKPKRRSK